jgi:uncharacterized membrane protein
MTTKRWILFIASFVLLTFVKAQNKTADSIAVTKRLQELLGICKNVNFADPKTTELGTFYKAAPYIIYRGNDKKRAWKDFANYKNEEEKNGVNEVCYRINQSVNQDASYKIIEYFTEKESEGTWHILMINYTNKGVEKKVAFAFLKIGNLFGLGDID